MSSNMNIYVNDLTIVFSKQIEVIPFNDVTYFFGQMGSGKTSIARLVNYCLGGSIHLSPALQAEFVSAELSLDVNGRKITLQRQRESGQVVASWETDAEDFFTLTLPASVAEGIVLPGTRVEHLSDLLFHLAGVIPPKVRKSKLKENSELQRLSFRDLFWYCYIDQDNIDSSFFNLDEDSDTFKRYKSRDVMRFILGFHQEKVAELEAELHRQHIETLQLITAADSLMMVIKEAEIGTEAEISEEIQILTSNLNENRDMINREPDVLEIFPHAADLLKERARYLANEIEPLSDAIGAIAKRVEQDIRHKNEITMLNVKMERTAAARAVLGGVEFCSCPRCAQDLPARGSGHCIVCGQVESALESRGLSPVLKEDAKARISELGEIIELQQEQKKTMEKKLSELVMVKDKIDLEISQQLAKYDSAYLSTVLLLEKENSQLEEKISNLDKMKALPQKVKDLSDKALNSKFEEMKIRNELKAERVNAERDLTNVDRLKELYLDCLLRCKLPGINVNSEVHIKVSDFLPIVINPSLGDVAVTSFSNLSSGGKKTLFKACFAIAMHRLAVEIGALLPSILIIDSPMKNISERENKEQFEHFHNLIYELVSDELAGTQFILIDKEHFDPVGGLFLNMSVRHMTLNEPHFPPLVPYYKE
jgi:hypothetical protein